MKQFELVKNAFSRYLGRNINLLIDISHPEFEREYHFINNTKPVTVEDIVYEPYPFDIILPAQTETQGTQITLSNVQNIAANEIRKTILSNENIVVSLFVANIETEITEKYPKGTFELFDVSITPEAITGTINIRHCLDINCGSIRYNRQLFPNLYL